MIDWEAFKRGEFAVRCDTEGKAKAFLRECDIKGLRWWGSGAATTDYSRWERHKGKTCYLADDADNTITFSDSTYFGEKGTPVIDYPTIPDQSLKADAGKPQLTLVPTGIIRAIAAVREHGVHKYQSRDSWRKVDKQRYRDALYRHWLAYLDNPDGVDADSGLPHLWHCAANIAFLIELEGRK